MSFGRRSLASDDDDDPYAGPTTPMVCETPQPQPPHTPVIEVIPSRPSDLVLASMAVMDSLFAAPVSHPASPGGPSSPPLEQLRKADIVPPTRPSSTPFPHPETRTPSSTSIPLHAADGIETGTALALESASATIEPPTMHMSDSIDIDLDAVPLPPPQASATHFDDLPAEIHECILDHLFGYRVSATSKSSVGLHSVTRSWGTALRHSRRKELSALARVNPCWRDLIQGRLYRHIKLRATVRSLDDAAEYFVQRPHLRHYVKHVEIWFPVFQPKYGPLALGNTLALPTVTVDGLTNATYVLPGDNSTLEEALGFVRDALPGVTILTLEGGERKKAPRVEHFFSPKPTPPGAAPEPRTFPVLRSVQTLVTKGQWNLMRDETDFQNVLAALPNLKEWHGSYSKPKSKSYLSMATILPRLPMTTEHLTHLNLCLEGDYRRELGCPPFFLKVANQVHFCAQLARAAPTLEHLSYTGRVCRGFFDTVAALVDPRSTRLKSIDLTVKNCCRPIMQQQDSGSGIQDMNFINAFELLVLAGIRSMNKLKALEYLRIRYVDLDSMCPPLNPYFILQDGWCSGVWSDNILTELSKARREARWVQLNDNFGEICISKDGRMVISPDYPRSKVLSLKLSNYALLTGGISIQ